MPTPKLLRLKAVIAISGYSRSQIYNLMAAGLWPRHIKLSERCTAWLETEIAAVLQARILNQTDEQIKQLVEQLHCNRQLAFNSLNE